VAVERESLLHEREHGVVDMLLLLGTVCLAVVTWAYVSEATGVALWKFYLGIALSWLLALAALTRHRQWAAWIRLLTAGWMIAAPHLLAFTDVAPARWAYVTTGMIVAVLSIPGVVSLHASGDRMAA
jgi:hypothetical protein